MARPARQDEVAGVSFRWFHTMYLFSRTVVIPPPPFLSVTMRNLLQKGLFDNPNNPYWQWWCAIIEFRLPPGSNQLVAVRIHLTQSSDPDHRWYLFARVTTDAMVSNVLHSRIVSRNITHTINTRNITHRLQLSSGASDFPEMILITCASDTSLTILPTN